jgi:DNA-binding beta-propeller fold protein YncE
LAYPMVVSDLATEQPGHLWEERSMHSLSKLAVGAGLILLASGAFAQGRLIAVDSSRALYEINMATGAKTQIGTVSANAGTTAGLAYDRGNDKVYLTSTGNDSLYTLDMATAAATLVGAYGDPAIVMHGLEWDSSTSTLYAMSSHNAGLYRLNTTTCAATLIGTTGLSSFCNIGYNSATNVMYMTNSGTDSSYTINRTTGAVTLLAGLGGPTNPNGLAYNHDNGLMYMVDNSTDNLYTLNMATGVATVVGSTGTGNLLGLVYINPQVVPEPATMAALGIGALALIRRRKKA